MFTVVAGKEVSSVLFPWTTTVFSPTTQIIALFQPDLVRSTNNKFSFPWSSEECVVWCSRNVFWRSRNSAASSCFSWLKEEAFVRFYETSGLFSLLDVISNFYDHLRTIFIERQTGSSMRLLLKLSTVSTAGRRLKDQANHGNSGTWLVKPYCADVRSIGNTYGHSSCRKLHERYILDQATAVISDLGWVLLLVAQASSMAFAIEVCRDYWIEWMTLCRQGMVTRRLGSTYTRKILHFECSSTQ